MAYAIIPDSPDTDLGNEFTVEMWFKRNRLNIGEILLEQEGGGPSIGLYNFFQDFIALGQAPAGASWIGIPGVSDNAWHHVAVKHEAGGNGYIYFDGAEITANNTGNPPLTFTSGGRIWVGSGVDGVSGFQGAIDELAFYKTVLTAQQIQDHYVAGVGMSRPSLEIGGNSIGPLGIPSGESFGDASFGKRIEYAGGIEQPGTPDTDFLSVSGKNLRYNGANFLIKGVNSYQNGTHATWDSVSFEIENSYLTREDFVEMKRVGLNNCRWMFSFSDWDLFRDDFFAKLDQAVAGAREAGIFITPCCSTLPMDPNQQQDADASDLDASEVYSRSYAPFWRNDVRLQDRFIDMWVDIANYYKHETSIAMYDILNEPTPDTEFYAVVYWDLCQVIYDAIRAVDPNHVICFEAAGNLAPPLGTFPRFPWSDYPGVPAANPVVPARNTGQWPIQGTNICYSLHSYAPIAYTHNVPPTPPGGGQTPTGSWPGWYAYDTVTQLWNRAGIENYYRTRRTKQMSFMETMGGGQCIVLGEFGAVRNPGRDQYLADLIDFAQDMGWSWNVFAWREAYPLEEDPGGYVEDATKLKYSQSEVVPISTETPVQWSPGQPRVPDGTAPIQINVPTGGWCIYPPAQDPHGNLSDPNICAPLNRDIIYNLPAGDVWTGSVSVVGGRNHLWRGGKCIPNGNAGQDGPGFGGNGGARIRIQEMSGDVWMEGAHLDMDFKFGDGIAIYGQDSVGRPNYSDYTKFPDIYINNSLVENMAGGFGTFHSDAFQQQGSIGKLVFDHFTLKTNYQGIFVAHANPIESMEIRHCNGVAQPGAGNAILFWLLYDQVSAEAAGVPVTQGAVPYPKKLFNVYAEPISGYTVHGLEGFGSVMPSRGDGGPTSGIDYLGRDIAAVDDGAGGAIWPQSWMMTQGGIKLGPPVGGDIVKEVNVGMGYGSVSKPIMQSQNRTSSSGETTNYKPIEQRMGLYTGMNPGDFSRPADILPVIEGQLDLAPPLYPVLGLLYVVSTLPKLSRMIQPIAFNPDIGSFDFGGIPSGEVFGVVELGGGIAVLVINVPSIGTQEVIGLPAVNGGATPLISNEVLRRLRVVFFDTPYTLVVMEDLSTLTVDERTAQVIIDPYPIP